MKSTAEWLFWDGKYQHALKDTWLLNVLNVKNSFENKEAYQLPAENFGDANVGDLLWTLIH